MVADTGGRRGFGLAGEAPRETIRAAAKTAERLGYFSFWLSQPPGGDSLHTLAEMVPLTSSIRLGAGALPLTEWPAERIAGRVRGLGLPLPRLVLGVGSGIGAGAPSRVRDAVAALRSELAVELAIAPLGPRMCALAGELADIVLLNWLTPRHVQTSLRWIEDGAAAARRDPPAVAAYVRCALGRDARVRLAREAERYAALPHYAAHFARQQIAPPEAAIAADTVRDLREHLDAYAALLDQVIVRAITARDTVEETVSLLEAAAPDSPPPTTD